MPARIDLKGIDGKPVKNALRPLTVHIIPQDVKQADVKHPESCAAARAILRECNAVEARVHLGRVYVRKEKGGWTRYQTPLALRAEIIAFDRGGSFEPGEYTLLPVPPANRPTGRRMGAKQKKVPRKMKKSGTRPKVTANVRSGPKA